MTSIFSPIHPLQIEKFKINNECGSYVVELVINGRSRRKNRVSRIHLVSEYLLCTLL